MQYYNEKALIDLRRSSLVAILIMLGYSSIQAVGNELDPSAGYRALDRIGRKLESYKNLALVNTYPEDIGKSVIVEAGEDFKNDMAFIEARKELFNNARGIYPEFCRDMNQKVSAGEWKTYSDVVQETARLYLALNADTIEPEALAASGVANDLTSLSGVELEDKIADLIDSKRFRDAVLAEARFYRSEARTFDAHREEIDSDDPKVISNGLRAVLDGLSTEVNAVAREKEQIEKNYTKFDKIFSSKELRLSIDEHKDEHSRDER